MYSQTNKDKKANFKSGTDTADLRIRIIVTKKLEEKYTYYNFPS
jgi:hypothetical protein